MKATLLSLILVSFTTQAAIISDDEANKFITDYLTKTFIYVKPLVINDSQIEYDAIVGDRKCNIIASVGSLPDGKKQMLVEKMDCYRESNNSKKHR